MATPRRSLVLLPMLIFSITYVLTCALGAVALLLNLQPFVDLFEYFSGTNRAPLGGQSLVVTLILLFVAPILMWVGYGFVVAGINPDRIPRRENRPPSVALWIPYAVFGACAVLAIVSLMRASSFASLGAWFNFASWVHARWRTFQVLSFFEFVNIYLMVPFSAAWVSLEARKPGLKWAIFRWAPALCAIAVAIPLFQKKAAVVSVIIIAAANVLQLAFDGKQLQRMLVVGGSALLVLYFAMVVVPTINTAASAEQQIAQRQPASTPTASPPPSPASSATPASSPAPQAPPMRTISVVATGPMHALITVAYAFLAPVTRTSAPALYYAIIFPSVHPFYGLDVGQDILCSPKIGCHGVRMPDDNVVVWNFMNPTVHGGTTAVPFQFALYAQVGLPGALVGSLLVGALLGVAWIWVLRRREAAVVGPLWATLIVTFAIYLAIDSLRNSTVVSYGLVWPALLVAAITAARSSRLFADRSHPRSPANHGSVTESLEAAYPNS